MVIGPIHLLALMYFEAGDIWHGLIYQIDVFESWCWRRILGIFRGFVDSTSDQYICVIANFTTKLI